MGHEDTYAKFRVKHMSTRWEHAPLHVAMYPELKYSTFNTLKLMC
jgi:hypothetical protein